MMVSGACLALPAFRRCGRNTGRSRNRFNRNGLAQIGLADGSRMALWMMPDAAAFSFVRRTAMCYSYSDI